MPAIGPAKHASKVTFGKVTIKTILLSLEVLFHFPL